MFLDFDPEQECCSAVAFKQPADPSFGNAFIHDAAEVQLSLILSRRSST